MELKPVNCGCGGEAFHDTVRGWNPVREDALVLWHRVICKNCGTQTKAFYIEAEAIQAWNKAMGAKDINVPAKERTAKVIEHKYYIGTALNIVGAPKFGYEYLCENCKKKVISGDEYCSHCGCKLEWNERPNKQTGCN